MTTTTNNSQTYYPSANAVPLQNDSNQRASPAMATAVVAATPAASKEPSFRDQYANAQVVGSDVSPFSTRLIDATETHATATAFDPWSRQKTVATETEENERPTFVYHPPQSSVPYTSPNDYNNNTGTTVTLPAAALEDPRHKKKRRRARRRGRMIAGGAAGFVVGTIILGPLGAILLGAGGASIARSASKAGERRKDQRVRRQVAQAQQQALQGDLQRVVITRR
jgi:hypothetical protein